MRNLGLLVSCALLIIIHSSHGSEIIGGKEVRPHSLPFMAYVRSDSASCGGTLIHPQWVLTAAHCTDVDKVILGAHSISNLEADSKQYREVERRFPHPSYQHVFQGNDLMLLKLKQPARQTRTVNWLMFSNIVSDPAPGSQCMVAGWGATENSKWADVLRAVDVVVIDRQTCNSADYYDHSPFITREMVCAGSDGTNMADTCQGDSGGPLLCNGGLVGVTSFGRGCGVIKKPGVYSFISERQLQWIRATMNANRGIHRGRSTRAKQDGNL